MKPERNIILTGFMGTGKSSTGKHMARELGRPFIDTDEQIERRTGRKISEIFAADGEPAFRALEKSVLTEALSRERSVIITGGGAVIDADNRRLMRERGFVVALTATPETILSRVGRTKHRPLLSGAEPLAEIRRLSDERRAFYADCDVSLETDGRTPFEMAQIVLQVLKEKGVV